MACANKRIFFLLSKQQRTLCGFSPSSLTHPSQKIHLSTQYLFIKKKTEYLTIIISKLCKYMSKSNLLILTPDAQDIFYLDSKIKTTQPILQTNTNANRHVISKYNLLGHRCIYAVHPQVLVQRKFPGPRHMKAVKGHGCSFRVFVSNSLTKCYASAWAEALMISDLNKESYQCDGTFI